MDERLLNSMTNTFCEQPEETVHRMALIDYLIENNDPRAELLGLIPQLLNNIHNFKSHLSHVFEFDNEKYMNFFPLIYGLNYSDPCYKVLGKLLGVGVLWTNYLL